MQNSKPYIAVCMATYNGEAYIAEQIESIFAQTYSYFKIYIADDQSHDKTSVIVRSFQKRYPDKISLIHRTKHVGVVKNFELLLEACSEAYIVLADQDDIWEKYKLEVQLKAMLELEEISQEKRCLVHSDLSVINQDALKLYDSYFNFRGYKLDECKDLGHILGPSGVMGNTIMINAKLRDKILPFPPSLEIHDYWIGVVAELYGSRRTLSKPLVRYRIHKNNASNSLKSIDSKVSIRRWLHRDLRLPYMESTRAGLMQFLLTERLTKEDRHYIEAFYKYLTFSKSRISLYMDLLRYSLVKRSLKFRVLLLLKILITKRYSDH